MGLEDVLLKDEIVCEGFFQRLVYFLVMDGGPVKGEKDDVCLLFLCQGGVDFEGVDSFRRFCCI